MTVRRKQVRPVYTIGHSNHPLDSFVALLQQHGINALVDVRSTPHSRHHPQFNRETLEPACKAQAIKYVFLGRELGARSDDISCYENGRVQYDRLAGTDLFHQGIERILKGAEEFNLALMCAEHDPLDCHRTILVARVLVAQGIEVLHILRTGGVESHDEAMNRLLVSLSMPGTDLFHSREELVSEALARQEARIAYVNPRMVSNPDSRHP